ncbi:hypothetical protein [Saccharomonospora sp. NB11]|uniref:hypothetical protein n=1 Tax=Saccharomonospora sp. NB11 TaxID=1642298 RepID=UPI0018D03905|nr:hypothetical protein [Saccharomonospora sp. NB11]
MFVDPWRKESNKARANEKFTPDELDYMRSMLDDEDVSKEVKQNFLYALSNADRLSDDEIDRYASEIGADAFDVKWGGSDIDANMTNARRSLTTARTENLDGDVRRSYEVVSAGGFSTSDEIVDQTEVIIQWFAEFYSRYQVAQQVIETPVVVESGPRELPTVDSNAFTGSGDELGTAKYTHSGIDPESLRAGLDEFRGIDFAAFRADVDMLRSSGSAVADKAAALDSAWKGTEDWTGDAKASAEQVNKNLSDGSEALQDALMSASSGLDEVTTVQEDTVVHFSEELFRLYHDGKIAGLTVSDVDDALSAAWVADSALNKGVIALFEDTFTEMLDSAKEVLAGFCQSYQEMANHFHTQAKLHVEQMDNNYSLAVQELTLVIQNDPTADLGQGGDSTSPSGVETGGPGGGMPGGGMPGGGVPGGGATVPSAEELLGQQPDTATNPVTGEPLEIDPETGEPYPIDPETGETIKDAGGPGTLTVEHGDQKFTMTEPGDDGKMSITVEDSDGEFGEYELDFGTDVEPGEEPGDDKTGDFGPTGSDGESKQVYRPGPDGKIHIKDGDLEIVAEQPDGPDGPTVITVDNGKDDPVTYTLGAEQDGKGSFDEGVRVMPAQADPAADPRHTAEPLPGAAGGQGGGSPDGAAASAFSASGAEAAPAAAGGGNVGGTPAAFETNADVSSGPASAEMSDSSGSTHPAAVGGGGGSAFGGGGGGGELPETEPGGSDQPRPSGAGLGVAPGGDGPTPSTLQGSGGATSSSGGGGMGMMGGMGAMGGGAGGGQGGGDQERSSAYRIDGNIFDVASGAVRVSGVLGDDNEVPVRFSR